MLGRLRLAKPTVAVLTTAQITTMRPRAEHLTEQQISHIKGTCKAGNHVPCKTTVQLLFSSSAVTPMGLAIRPIRLRLRLRLRIYPPYSHRSIHLSPSNPYS